MLPNLYEDYIFDYCKMTSEMLHELHDYSFECGKIPLTC